MRNEEDVFEALRERKGKCKTTGSEPKTFLDFHTDFPTCHSATLLLANLHLPHLLNNQTSNSFSEKKNIYIFFLKIDDVNPDWIVFFLISGAHADAQHVV